MRSVVIPEVASTAVKESYAQILAVHAALLHTGKVLYFSGDEHDPGRHSLGNFDHARLFDCQTLAITSPAPSASIRDLFCCGHAFLPNGRLLVAGGTEEWTIELAGGGDPHGHAGAGHFRGTAESYTYDTANNEWDGAARMVPEPGYSTGGGRWYPTLVTLGNGKVFAISGHPSDADHRHYNDTIEEYGTSPSPAGQWTDVGVQPSPMGGYPDLTYYPRAHLLKNGKLFFSSSINGQSMTLDTTFHVWIPVCAGPAEVDYSNGINTNSVLLPLLHEAGYSQSVLLCGREQARRINLDTGSPSWQPTLPRTLLVNGVPPVRNHCNSVLLPTGEVAVVGGMVNPQNDPGSAVHQIEIYRPSTNSWVTLPSSANTSVARNYHSVALLLPDGRVWMAGSNINANWSFHNAGDYSGSLPTNSQDDAIDNRRLQIELFEPWYFGRSDRPTFTLAGNAVSVGSTFHLNTPQASSISRVAVIRAGSSTHSFNPDQRYIGLPFSRSGNDLAVSVPDNENLLPPGYYLVFILASVVDPDTSAILDVPSVGTFIRISNTKVSKELKWELKELKPELKENLKQEVDIYKVELIEDRPKNLKDMVELDPLEKLKWLVDPIMMLSEIARQVDNLNRQVGQGHAFIKGEERPPVGIQPKLTPSALERTPPPSPEELARLELHGHEPGQMLNKKPEHEAMDEHGPEHPKEKTEPPEMKLGPKPETKRRKGGQGDAE
jgi:hypothetical protein